MSSSSFQRARSIEAKQHREQAILAAARSLGTEHGVRRVTLTGVADAVGMHKSAMLRYFETREEIFLILTGKGWREWSAAICGKLNAMTAATPASVAATVAESLVERPFFCDLLAQAPLNLERNVSLDAVRSFKLITLDAVAEVASELQRLLALDARQATDSVATATSMAGALWNMAAPGTTLAELYRNEPELAHAIVDVAPQLTRILRGLLSGFLVSNSHAGPGFARSAQGRLSSHETP